MRIGPGRAAVILLAAVVLAVAALAVLASIRGAYRRAQNIPTPPPGVQRLVRGCPT